MWPLLKELWTDKVAARTALLSAIAFAIAFYAMDPTLALGARVALALGQTFLVGAASFSPARGRSALQGVGKVGLVIVALSAFVGLGCASSKSIPTSSDANVSADVVTAKGGTIACASALSATLDPATGNVTSLTCAANGAWTDPPTAEETTALGQLGESLVDLARMPFEIIAAAGRAAAAVAPAP